jgi:tetratricopeptide (TPR) repeat protein
LALAAAYLALRFWPRAGETPAPGTVPALAAAARGGRPVLFVGLDGADWQLLDRYLAAGAMPELAALVAGGRSGVLASLEPPLSPLVWTTMTTGVSPLAHGVLDFTRFAPESGRREPITAAERRVPAVWEMAGAAGKRVAVFGLWATWPAQEVPGLLVADRFLMSRGAGGGPPPGSVFPPAREAWARQVLAATDQGVDLAALQAYLPWLDEAGYRAALAVPEPFSDPVAGLRRLLVETRTTDRLARQWLAAERPDLALVYFEGTDLVGHLFAPLTPPRRPGVSDEELRRFGGVAEAYFREVDGLLGEYRRLAAARGAVLVVASDHGFAWGEARPLDLPSREAATAGQWHRREGIYLLWGPGIAPAPGVREEAGVARVCATLLALLGLPPGRGLAGPPLPGVAAPAAAAVDYRALIPRRRPVPPAAAPGSAEAVARLRALGYVGGGDRAPGSARDAADPTRTPASFNNEGLLLRGEGRTAEAAAAFERALALDPAYPSALWNLSELLFAQGRDAARADRLLVAALAAGLPRGSERVTARAAAWHRRGEAGRAAALLDAALAARPTAPDLHLWRGRLRQEAGDCAGALGDFETAVKAAPDDPLAHASVGLARACLGDRAGARAALGRSLALDPDQPEVRRALASLDGPSL